MPKKKVLGKDLEAEGQLSFAAEFWPEEAKEEPKPASNTQAKNQTPARDSLEYWSKCDQMLTSWGPYVGRQDLLDNARNEQTKWKVWHIVEKTFGGSLLRLKSRVSDLEDRFNGDYNAYVKACSDYGVEAAPMKWMRSHLWEGADIISYRGRCRTCKGNPSKYPAVSLLDLPPRKPRKKK